MDKRSSFLSLIVLIIMFLLLKIIPFSSKIGYVFFFFYLFGIVYNLHVTNFLRMFDHAFCLLIFKSVEKLTGSHKYVCVWWGSVFNMIL